MDLLNKIRLHFATTPSEHPLTDGEKRTGRFRITLYSTISVIFGTAISDRVISLYVLHMYPDISNAALACFFAIPPLLGILTAVISPLVDIIGKKRITTPMYLMATPFLAALLGVSWLERMFSPLVALVVFGFFLAAYYTFRALGFAGWFPLINDNVPGETRGRFFGRLRTTWQTALVISTALLGWFFGDSPDLWRFQVVFGLAFLLNVAGTVVIASVPEQPVVPRRMSKSFFQMMLMPFRNKVFVNFMVFGGLYSLALGLAGQFSIRCMVTTLGAGDNVVVWMSMMSSIGAAVMLSVWGRFVDRFGSRAIFTLLLPPIALMNLVWLIMSPDLPSWRIWLGAYYFVQGIFISGVGVGTTDMMLGSSGRAYRSAYINVSNVINTVAVGVAPFLGTLVTMIAGDSVWNYGWLWLDGNRLVFVARFLLLLAPMLMLRKMSRRYGGEVRLALKQMSQSARRHMGSGSLKHQ